MEIHAVESCVASKRATEKRSPKERVYLARKEGNTLAVTDLTPPARKIEASQKRPPLWRNSKFLSWLAQIVILLLVVGAFLFLSLIHI